MLKKRLFKWGIFLLPIVITFSQCLNLKKPEDPRGSIYAGSQTCVSCHKNIYNSSLHTAHFMASLPADDHTVQGNFHKGANEYIFNAHMKVVMEKRDSGLYQSSYINGKIQQSQRFDISFGGIKGQTYAYWVSNELFQLPISFVSNKSDWVNSPGYDPNKVVFERVIGTKCLNCHASYIKQAPANVPGFNGNYEGFEKKSLIYSIDCERCHGPAAAHVKFHVDNPNEKTAKYIARFNSLTRAQKLDMCAVCHSGGNSLKEKATFGFKPGDTLSNYIKTVSVTDYNHIDVHGNQRGLLASSQCFMNSKMDCSTCHDTHVNDRNNFALYASRCQVCHNNQSHNICKLSDQLTANVLKSNCISCHMPALPSKAIITDGLNAVVHTHHIAVYPEQTRKIIAYLKSGKH